MQKGFIFDANQCTGCQACQLACAIENRLEPTIDWRRVHTFNPRHLPGIPTLHNSTACHHCAAPACMEHCPALAYSKDPATGAVTLAPEKCIGCKYCSWACPYDAPQFNERSGLMEKCTLCSHRLADGMEPACVALCPTGALGFEDHDGTSGASSIPGFTPTEIGPSIRFVPLRSERPVALASRYGDPPAQSGAMARPRSRIGLGSEWTLLGFTFCAALLVAWVTAAAIAGTAPPPGILLPAGLAAMAWSTLHLGRKGRAWRAILNLRNSWLSREVLLFPAFLALATAAGFVNRAGGVTAWAAALAGFAALFAMDRVYSVTRTPGLARHSAQVVLTGLLFTAMFASATIATTFVFGVKLALYAFRKARFVRENRPGHASWGWARVGIGIGGLFLFADDRAPVKIAGVLAVVAAELIDRAEYYVELDPPSPGRQMAEELTSAALTSLDAFSSRSSGHRSTTRARAGS